MTLDPRWEAESQELLVRCDRAGVVRELDARARRRLCVAEGDSLLARSAPGVEEKLAALVARGAEEVVRGSEVPLVCEGRVCTFAFTAVPDGAGGVLLLGSTRPRTSRARSSR